VPNRIVLRKKIELGESPSISYLSGQPGIAGNPHEALNGIADSARFSLAEGFQRAREMLQKRQVEWVFVYDWDLLGQNSASLLGSEFPSVQWVGSWTEPRGQGPRYLVLSAQNGAAKLFRFASKI